MPSEIVLRQKTWRDAAAAQEAMGRLDERVRHVPGADMWAQQVFRREIRASASLDDVLVTTREAYLVDETHSGGHPLAGYLRAGVEVAGAARAGRPLTVELLGRISAVMHGPADDDIDRWRTGPAWLGGPRPQDAYLLVAPPGAEMWVAAEQWCSWTRTQDELPVVVKAVVAFVQFLLLSPFPGAGHLARLALLHELMVAGVLSAPVLPLSGWVYRQRERLPSLVRGVVERGGFDELVSFLATGIRSVCAEEEFRIDKARAVVSGMADRFARKTSMATLVEALGVTPAMTLRQVADTCGVSLSQAANLARRLQSEGVVESIDLDSLRYQSDDAAYRKVIFVPEVLHVLLDIIPPFAL